MADELNDSERKIDALRQDFEKSEIERKANDKIQEANMKTLEATMRELVAENKAASEKSLAETKVEFQQLRTSIEKQGKYLMAFVSGLAGVVIAAVGVMLVWPGVG